MADKTRITIVILVVIILVLAGISIYTLVIRPNITGYAVDAQNQGYTLAIAQIMQLAAQCQQIPLFSGNATNNITLNLIAIECLQQQQAQQQQEQQVAP